MSNRTWLDHPLTQLTITRFREFLREPEAVFWAIAFPIVLAVGLGIAFRNQSPEIVRVATASPAIGASLRREPLLRVDDLSAEAALAALRTGKVLLVVEPAADGGVSYRYDDTNPEARAARRMVDRALQRGAGQVDPVPVRDEIVREPGARYIDFLIPGLVGMGVMGNAVWGLGFSIVDARRRKLMKRIVATPMSRQHYLMAQLFWRMGLLVVEVAVPIGVGVVAFGVPVRGSLAGLVAICVLGSLAFSALGLLVASRARTIEAVSGLANLVMMPMWILSGVFFSSQRFPDVVQPFVKSLPLTALNDALRAQMLQGATLVDVAPEIAVLTAWLVACFGLALKLFRWR